MKNINEINKIIAIAYRELIKIVKDINLLSVFLLAPILYPALYGYIYYFKVETKVPIAILDYDNSSLSRSLIRDFDSHQNIRIKNHLSNDSQIEEYISTQKVNAVVVIPTEFSENIKKGKRSSIKLFISPGRLLVLSDAGIPISQITNYFSAKITAVLSEKMGIRAFTYKAAVQPLKLSFQNLFNPYLTYGDMILPALIMIILSQLVFIGVAASTAKEWSNNGWQGLFEISNTKFDILIGKLITHSLIFLFFAIFIRLVWVNIFEIQFLGNNLILLFIVFMGILSISSFGLFIGTFFKHRINVFVALGFTSYPFFMMTGYAWSEPQLPELIKFISYFIPMTPLLKSMFYYSQMGLEYDKILNWTALSLIQTIIYSALFLLRLKMINRSTKLVYCSPKIP